MLLETGRCRVKMDAHSIGCFSETDVTKINRDGCSPHRMLLETGRYQAGRDEARPIDASRNRTLPGRQR